MNTCGRIQRETARGKMRCFFYFQNGARYCRGSAFRTFKLYLGSYPTAMLSWAMVKWTYLYTG